MSAPAIVTPRGQVVLVYERCAWKGLLGIRFFEHGLDRPVTSGLAVTAYAVDERRAPRAGIVPARALPNPEGVYVFHALPPGWGGASPPPEGALAIEVRDLRARFLPVVYVTADPFAEPSLFLTAAGPVPEDAPGGAAFYLFSSPARHVSTRDAAVIRAQLWDRANGRPAAYAVLEVARNGHTWYGLADGRGSALVPFPYPPVTPSPGDPPQDSPGESPGGLGTGLYDQSWEVEVRVRYQRDEPLPVLPGFGLPELGAIAGQPYAPVVPASGEPPVDSLRVAVAFGRESTLRTVGESVLWV